MTRTPSDQFSKQYLEAIVSPLDPVEISQEIPGENGLTSGLSPIPKASTVVKPKAFLTFATVKLL